jgi:signal transduction histidine kinase
MHELIGSGEMFARCRAFDWASTVLGPVATWSHSLRTIASTLLASRHPMFLWWGPELVQIYNDAYRPSFGDGGRHPRALGARGREFWPEIWHIIGPEIDSVLATGEATWHENQLVPIERNGRIESVWWTYSYSAVRDDDGSIAGVLVVVQETTAQVLALAAAERARAEAEAANRSKSEFLAVMSHELRTPLNAIGGYADLIELGVRGPVTAEQRADLARIQQSQRHLLGLINGVLNYTRVEAGVVYYALTDVPVAETLVACEALTSPQARARGLTVTVDGGDPALTVRADPEKLQQIVLNLLTNAIKFTGTGGRIALRAATRDDAVEIAVEDTGRGIALAQLARVFEPFVQIDAMLTRTNEGVGLGLAISRDLARGMGGDITVRSVPGEGSTFTVTLPRGVAAGA